MVAKIGVDTAENEPSKVSGGSEFHIRIPPSAETSETEMKLLPAWTQSGGFIPSEMLRIASKPRSLT